MSGKFIGLVMLAVLMGSLVCAPAGFVSIATAATEEKVVIKVVVAWPPNNMSHTLLRDWWVKEANARSQAKLNGKLRVEIAGGPEVVNPVDLLKALRAGSFDAGDSSVGYYGGEYPLGEVTDWLDYNKSSGFPINEDCRKVVQKYWQDKANLRWMGLIDIGPWMIFTAKKPVRSLDDLKGLKIRSIGGWSNKLLEGLGAAPVRIAAHELTTALQQGVVDGSLRMPHNVIEFGEATFYKYALATPLGVGTSQLWFSTKRWDELPSDVKNLLTEVNSDWQKQMWGVCEGVWHKPGLETLKKTNAYTITEPLPNLTKRINELRVEIFSKITEDPTYGKELKAVFERYYAP